MALKGTTLTKVQSELMIVQERALSTPAKSN